LAHFTVNKEPNLSIQIYHNPRCSKSRATLALLEANGHAPEVIEYLKTPPDARTIRELVEKLGIKSHELLRKGESEYQSLALQDPTDEQVVDAIVKHPILLQRPIVVAGDRAAIGRPPEAVLDILS
jgi:arsenate reductase